MTVWEYFGEAVKCNSSMLLQNCQLISEEMQNTNKLALFAPSMLYCSAGCRGWQSQQHLVIALLAPSADGAGLQYFLDKEEKPCCIWGRESDVREPGNRKRSLALRWGTVSSQQRMGTSQLPQGHALGVSHRHTHSDPSFSATSWMGSSAPCSLLTMTFPKVSLRRLLTY